MKQKGKEESYLETFIEYQKKIYIPGYYVGGKIHPALKAKTKAGGYLMVIGGIFLLCFYLFLIISNFSVESISGVVPVAIAVLLIIVGFKFIKLNSPKK